MLANLEGLIVPMVTLDCEDYNHALSGFLVDSGVAAIFRLGRNGEFEKQAFEQKKEMIVRMREIVYGNTKLLVGVTGKSNEETIKLTGLATDYGADAAVIMPTYQTELSTYKFTDSVLGSASIDLIFYNNPGITDGRMIPIEDLNRFAMCPRIKGVKDSSGNADYFSELLKIRERNPGFKVYHGSEELMIARPDLEMDGIVSGTANFEPLFIKTIYEAIKKGLAGEVKGEIAMLRRIHETYRSGDAISIIKGSVGMLDLERYKKAVSTSL